jgi:hypothetical protein
VDRAALHALFDPLAVCVRESHWSREIPGQPCRIGARRNERLAMTLTAEEVMPGSQDQMNSLILIVPVKGKIDVLSECLDSMIRAVAGCDGASLTIVDNNPGEAIDESLGEYVDVARVIKSRARTAGGVRNDGVAGATGSLYLAFVDCDCLVRPTFCRDVLEAFQQTASEVVGCKVLSPSDGHWTERTMDEIHRHAGDGPRESLNTGCLAVRFDIFTGVGGFDANLPSNEDYDFCKRVRLLGGRIWQSEALAVVHLGNPKSTSGYFSRLVWHGKGAFASSGKVDWSPMLVFVLGNAFVLASGLMYMTALVVRGQAVEALASLAVALLAVPLSFIVIRMTQYRRRIPLVRGTALMQLTFIARLCGFVSQYFILRRMRP